MEDLVTEHPRSTLNLFHIGTWRSNYRRGFGFIDHFNTRLVTTFHYSAIANLHTLQITTARATSFESAFTSRFPVTDLNNGDSSTAQTKSSLHRLPYDWLCYNWLASKLVSVITSRLRPTENTALLLLLKWFPWERICLRRRYPVTAAYISLLKICCLAASFISLFISRSIPSNGSTRYNILEK
jgi:hypothetical protein